MFATAGVPFCLRRRPGGADDWPEQAPAIESGGKPHAPQKYCAPVSGTGVPSPKSRILSNLGSLKAELRTLRSAPKPAAIEQSAQPQHQQHQGRGLRYLVTVHQGLHLLLTEDLIVHVKVVHMPVERI